MTMSEAIQVAIKGGYSIERYGRSKQMEEILLDPSFWQSFSDIMGLSILSSPVDGRAHSAWLYHWHRFIDWLAEERDPEDFFDQFTKP